MNEAILQYLTERHASIQWRDFIATIGSELHAEIGAEATSALIARAGARFAGGLDLGECGTLADFERGMAQIWLDMDWGWTQIEDGGDALTISHACAPVGGLTPEGAGLVGAFLQGAYQQWTTQLGGSGQLLVTQTDVINSAGGVTFRVALPAGH